VYETHFGYMATVPLEARMDLPAMEMVPPPVGTHWTIEWGGRQFTYKVAKVEYIAGPVPGWKRGKYVGQVLRVQRVSVILE